MNQFHIKDYLSYSQFTTFLRSPESYRKIYIFDYKFRNKYTDFGSKIHEVLELREAKDEDEKLALKILPKTQEREVEILTKIRNVPLFGKIDAVNQVKDGWLIKEYKTSKNGWSQGKVNSSMQLTFYALMFSRAKGIPVDKISLELDCLKTFEDIDGSLHLTGEVQKFKTKRVEEDFEVLIPEIQKVWSGIGKMINELIKI